MSAPEPEALCRAVRVGQLEAKSIEGKPEQLTEPNKPPIAYFICGVGWSHMLEFEVKNVE
ncbi:MAG: hypothetical protein QXP81_09835 [Nitrososphaerota archaeon]